MAALKNSLNAFKKILRHEKAFQAELFIFSPLFVFLMFASHIMIIERLLLLGSLFAVLICEILNTAVEATVDNISLEHRELSKLAKDLGSLAVTISILFSGICWVIIVLVPIIYL